MKHLVRSITTNTNGHPNFLGFESFTEFCESLLRIKDWTMNSFGATIAVMTSFITGYMWDSPNAVYTLWVLMGADWLTGLGKSIKHKRFESYKVFRMPVFYVATSFLVAISWWMAKGNIIFTPLPGIAMGGFYLVYFSSLLENLGELEWLPPKAVKILKTFGMKVIIDKYFPKEKEDEGESN
jgi:phage-related holin